MRGNTTLFTERGQLCGKKLFLAEGKIYIVVSFGRLRALIGIGKNKYCKVAVLEMKN